MIALVPGIGAYAAYAFCVADLGPSRTSLAMYSALPYVGVMAWAALGETPQWYHLLGIALVLPGLFLATRPSRAILWGSGAGGWTMDRRHSYE